MRIFYGILLSLLVHFILVLGLDKAAPYFETKLHKATKEVAEIELVESTPSKKSPARQIVREAIAPKSQLKEEDESLARFLSAERQRVKKESRAANSGLTQNRVQGKSQKPQAKDYDPDNIITRTLREQPRGFDPAPSTIGDALPQDVSIGSFTALNTDRYVYYSFFSRIEDLVRFRWESRVRQAVDTFDRSYILSVVGRKNWVTSMDIWITPDGRFHSAHILKECGIQKFDLAAVAAFREAGLFPNPPQEMVEEDGFIHLKYTFNVSFRPSTLVYQE